MLLMFSPAEIVTVTVNIEDDYKSITVYLKDGRQFTVESDD